MADTSKINESNIESLSDEQLSKMSKRELEDVVELLDKIRGKYDKLTDGQNRVAASAERYLRIMKESGEAIDENKGKLEEFTDRINQFGRGVSNIKETVTGTLNIVEGFGKEWIKTDDAAHQYAKTLGGTAKSVAQLRDESIKFVNQEHISAKYNTSISEMVKLQESYSKSVGRNLQLTNTQKESLVATSKVMGDKALDFSKKLENLGVGLERSGDIAGKMFAEASKSGISFEKYSASVTENLTKVQSYGFRNGVEGLTSMAKKAAEVNLNIGEAFKVADKIQSGGVEAAIKMGANLQVLGGSFAQFGDPMGMLYQGLNDIESLQDRMIDMFSHMGQIQNGQVKISGANRLRVNAAAQAMGISSDEMFNMINRQAVRGEVGRQMGGRFDGDEELKELIMNTATLNKDNQAVVNINGHETTLDKISSKDKQYLQDIQKSESEDIKDIAQMLRGYTETREGTEKQIEAKQAQWFKPIGNGLTKIYEIIGKSNLLLSGIAGVVAIISATQIAGTIGRGFGGAKRNISQSFKGNAASGSRVTAPTAKPRASGTAVPRQTTQTPVKANYTRAERVSAANELKAKGYTFKNGQIYRPDRSLAKGNVAKGGKVDAGRVLAKETFATKIGGRTGLKAAQGIAKFAGSTAGKMVGGGAMAGLFAGGMHLLNGDFKGDRATKNEAIGGTIGATIGGAIGQLTNFFLPGSGPFVSMITGAIGESVGGWIGKKMTTRQDKKRSGAKATVSAQLGKNTVEGKAFSNLKGDYSSKELKAIGKALSGQGELNKKLANKIAKNGDNEELMSLVKGGKSKERLGKATEKIKAKVDNGEFGVENANITINNADMPTAEPEVAYARGGKLEGPSDINGPGMPIQGTNIVVGGGEYVVNRDATAKNERLLDAINAGATFKMVNGGIIPTPTVRFENGGVIPVPEVKFDKGGKIHVPVKISNIMPSLMKNPMVPLPVKAIKGAVDMVRGGGIEKMEVAPIKLDVSGTIKLDSGGQQVDLNAIINNPAFLTELSQMIERRLSDNINGGNFKELRKNKRHTF